MSLTSDCKSAFCNDGIGFTGSVYTTVFPTLPSAWLMANAAR